MKSLYDDKYIDKLVYSYLLFTALFFTFHVFAKSTIDKYMNSIFLKCISLLSLLCVVHFSFNRNYYLPFLGDTVFPTGLLGNNVVPNMSDLTIEFKIKPNTKIIYWAAEPCSITNSCEKSIMAWDAYKNYENSGITTSNKEGIALLKVRSPQFYKVPFKSGIIKPHIHYRKILTDGMLSKIYTYKVN